MEKDRNERTNNFFGDEPGGWRETKRQVNHIIYEEHFLRTLGREMLAEPGIEELLDELRRLP